jgi:hypothetical protein
VGNDVIEFPMTVNSVEIPELGWSDSGERAVGLGHAEEILIMLATSKFLRLSVSWRSVSSAIRSTAAVGADGSVESLDEQ